MSRKISSHTWADLEGKIAPQVLYAPKTGGDPESSGARPVVHERIVGYLYYRMSGTPWTSHLALAAAVLTVRRLDVGTIIKMLGILHARLTELFPVLHLETMNDWDANVHMRAYLAGEVLPNTPDTVRAGFWKMYKAASMHVQFWLQSLPEDERSKVHPFVFPPVAPWIVEGLTKEEEISQRQRQHRKTETDVCNRC